MTRKETPEEYLDYLTERVEGTREKALGWMRVSLASHLGYASDRGWLTEKVEDAAKVVREWAEKKQQ